jgi:hypothetical protein
VPVHEHSGRTTMRRIRQAIGLTVAAAEQIDQDIHWQVFERMLLTCGMSDPCDSAGVSRHCDV